MGLGQGARCEVREAAERATKSREVEWNCMNKQDDLYAGCLGVVNLIGACRGSQVDCRGSRVNFRESRKLSRVRKIELFCFLVFQKQ